MKIQLGSRSYDDGLLILIFTVAFLLLVYMTIPLLDGMVLGLVFAYIGRPIRNLFGERRRLGSLVATICIVLPISVIIGLGAIEIVNQLLWLAEHQAEIVHAANGFMGGVNLPPFLYERLNSSIKNVASIVTSFAASVQIFSMGREFTLDVLNFILSLPVCYFLLADGYHLQESAIRLLPQDKVKIYQRYLARIDKILSGVYLGSIYTAIAGGLTSIVIFYLFGVPRPFALASMVFLAGIIPFMTWLVFIPTSIFRYFMNGPVDALAFFLVGSVMVHLVELIIRPYFVSAKSSIHPLLVLISFMGGGLVAGITGFFLAPALMGIIIAIHQVNSEGTNECEKEKEE